MADYELSARLEDQQIQQAFKNMETQGAKAFKGLEKELAKVGVRLDEVANRFRRLDNSRFVSTSAVLKGLSGDMSGLQKQSDTTFSKFGDGADGSSVRAGILAGATTAITNKLLEMGQAAVRGFAEIIKGSVESAKILEGTQASLTGIFNGDASAATAALDKIRQESIRLGVDLTELAPAFLPKVEDLDQFTQIGELVASLANLDPAQGAAGARLALSEALSGDVTSLRRRFEIDTGPIQEAQAQFGELEGLLIGLEEVLKSRGQDFETLSQTASATFNQTKQIAEDAKTTFGEPILDALKEDFQALNQFLLDNKDQIDIIAGSLGDLIADIADFTGDELLGFVEGLDLTALQEFVLEAQNLIDIIQTVREVSEQNPFTGFDGISEYIPDLFDLETALTAVVQIMGIINATAAAGVAAVTGYLDLMTRLASGDVNFSDMAEEMDNLTSSIKDAARDSINSANESIGAMNERLAENEQRLQNRITAQEQSNQADLDAANSILANKQALEAESKAADEAAAAQEKYNDARSELEIDKQRASDDLALKQQRELLDAEIEFAQKREDIARKNAQAIEDIYRKNKQKISDAAIDLRRDEEDIARKGARSQIEIEREAANRRVEIETDFRRELQRIRERFDFDAQEAIRQNDAIAFLRIQRQKDFELNQAQQQRDEEIQDAESSAVEQRQKLQEQLQLQIEDARIANQRKLEDLRLSLQRELQEQQIKYAREVQEAKIAEERKREEMARTFQRQNEDFNRLWERKLQDLIRNYQKEIQIMQQYEAQKAQIMAQSRASRAAASADRVLLQNYSLQSRDSRSNPIIDTAVNRQEAASADSVLLQNYSGRQFGGRVVKGVPYLVGERGPEPFVPDQSGTIYPNYRLKFNPSTAQTVNNITNTRQTNFNVDALMSTLSPQQIAIVQQLVNQLGMSMYS